MDRDSVLDRMREMLCEGSCMARIVRFANSRAEVQETPRALLMQAFCISVQDAKVVGEWLLDGTSGVSDRQLNELMLPAIVSSRDKWLPGRYRKCWLVDIELCDDPGYELTRPSHISEEGWRALGTPDKEEISCIVNSWQKSTFRTAILSALAEQLDASARSKYSSE